MLVLADLSPPINSLVYNAVRGGTLNNTSPLVNTASQVGQICMIASYASRPATGSAPAINSITGAGATWTRRAQSRASGGALELWSSTAVVTPGSVSITFASTVRTCAMIIINCTGIQVPPNTWDSHANSLANASDNTENPWQPSFSNRTTNNAPGLGLFIIGTNRRARPATPPAGYTLLTQQTQFGSAQDAAWICVAARALATNLGAATVTWGSAIESILLVAEPSSEAMFAVARQA